MSKDTSHGPEDGKEIFFLVAKYLKHLFPEVGSEFIRQCEARDLFPGSAVMSSPRFEDLHLTPFAGLPDDQLSRLANFVSPKSSHPSTKHHPVPPAPLAPADSYLSRLSASNPPFLDWAPSHRIVGHTDAIFAIALDISSQILITTSDDCRIKMWHIKARSLMRSLKYHSDVIADIAVHPSNRYFATTSRDSSFCLISLPTGGLIRRVVLPGELHMLKFSPCGRFLAVACEDGQARLWAVKSLLQRDDCLLELPLFGGQSAAWIDFSIAGEFVAFSGNPDQLIVFSFSKGSILKINGPSFLTDHFQFGRRSSANILSHTSDHCLRLSRSDRTLWDTESPLTARSPNSNAQIRFSKVRWTCDESQVVGIGPSALVSWATATGDIVARIQAPDFPERCQVLAPHPFLRDIVFVAAKSGLCFVVDLSRAEIFRRWTIDDGLVLTDAAWTVDGEGVIVADEAGGFTIVRSCTEPMTAGEQFFAGELANDTGGPVMFEALPIVDAAGEQLPEQPAVPKLPESALIVRVRTPQAAIDEEKKMLAKWPDGAAVRVADPAQFASHRVRSDGAISRADGDRRSSREDSSSASGGDPMPAIRSFVDILRDLDSGVDTTVAVSSSDDEPPPPPPDSDSDARSSDAEYSPISRKSGIKKGQRTKAGGHSFRPEPPPRRRGTSSDGELPSDDDPFTDRAVMSSCDWAWATEPRQHPFIPQLGELVAYCRAGHLALADQCECDRITPPYQLSPDLPPVAWAVVASVQSSIDHLQLTLEFRSWMGHVYFPLPDAPSFLTSADIFRRSMAYLGGLTIGSTVRAFYRGHRVFSELECSIVDLRKDAKDDPYGSITVRWAQFDDISEISPWELVLPEEPRMGALGMSRLAAPVKREVEMAITNPQFEPFVLLRDDDEQLFRIGQRPMDLTLLGQRLDNDWYHTPDELIQDVRRLVRNAATHQLLQRTACSLVLTLFTAITRGLNESRLAPRFSFDPKFV
jgi:WD40 repeat protein